jgi:hypothetical protein
MLDPSAGDYELEFGMIDPDPAKEIDGWHYGMVQFGGTEVASGRRFRWFSVRTLFPHTVYTVPLTVRPPAGRTISDPPSAMAMLMSFSTEQSPLVTMPGPDPGSTAHGVKVRLFDEHKWIAVSRGPASAD